MYYNGGESVDTLEAKVMAFRFPKDARRKSLLEISEISGIAPKKASSIIEKALLCGKEEALKDNQGDEEELILVGFDKSQPVYFSLEKLGHVFVNGSAGVGKTVLFENLIKQAHEKENYNVIVFDNKSVEYHRFKDIVEVITDPFKLIERVENLSRIHDSRKMIVFIDEGYSLFYDARNCEAILKAMSSDSGIQFFISSQVATTFERFKGVAKTIIQFCYLSKSKALIKDKAAKELAMGEFLIKQ